MDERLVAGMADAEAHALVIVAHMRGDRAQAVMPGIAAADLHAQLPGREVEFIVEDDNVIQGDFIEAGGFMHRAAGIVHESLRLDEHDPLAANLAFAGARLEARAERRKGVAPRDRSDRHEADIVAIARVACAGIAEADEEQHGDPVHLSRSRDAEPLLRFRIRSCRMNYFFFSSLAGAAFAGAGAAAAGVAPAAGAAAPGAAAAPAAAAGAGVSSARALGGASVTTVKSRSRIVGVQPSGSLIAEMCSESLKSRPARSAVIESGMLSAGTCISIVCRTTLSEPPRFRPGAASWLMKRTGTSTRMRVPGFSRRKSTCNGVSLTTASW